MKHVQRIILIVLCQSGALVKKRGKLVILPVSFSRSDHDAS